MCWELVINFPKLIILIFIKITFVKINFTKTHTATLSCCTLQP